MRADTEYLKAPDCTGLTVEECACAFAEAGFTAKPIVTWKGHARVPVGHTIRTKPPASAKVPTARGKRAISIRGSGVVIPTPVPQETYHEYRAKLIDAGFTTIDVHVLTPPHIWLSGVADAVTIVDPMPGEAIDPTQISTTVVSVRTNPAVMPEVAEQTRALANDLRGNNP